MSDNYNWYDWKSSTVYAKYVCFQFFGYQVIVVKAVHMSTRVGTAPRMHLLLSFTKALYKKLLDWYKKSLQLGSLQHTKDCWV